MMVKRNSNIELLRIVAMIMIIAYHIYYHCVWIQLTDANSIARLNNGLFNTPAFYRKLLVLITISPMGPVANTIFIIISGYFMVSKGKTLNLIKISQKLLLQQGFAAVLLTLGSTLSLVLFHHKFVNLITINAFNNMSWYVGYYFGIIVFANFFLNEFIDKLDKIQYKKFLLVIFAITQFNWLGGGVKFFSWRIVDFLHRDFSLCARWLYKKV